MKVGIGNDHRGVFEKELIISYFEENDIEYIDFGTDTEESVDYIDYAEKVSQSLLKGEIEKGILICGTGIGMCMAANKFKGIRCARVLTEEEARITREHNDANIIAIPEFIEEEELYNMVYAFINTPFSDLDRHKRRVDKLNNL